MFLIVKQMVLRYLLLIIKHGLSGDSYDVLKKISSFIQDDVLTWFESKWPFRIRVGHGLNNTYFLVSMHEHQ